MRFFAQKAVLAHKNLLPITRKDEIGMLNQINCAVYYGGGTSISADTPIFEPEFEYQETSMQVPCGFGSILSQLQDGLICAFEALVYLDLNRMSTWLNGETRWISASKLARVYDMSLRWVREVLYVRLGEMGETLQNR